MPPSNPLSHHLCTMAYNNAWANHRLLTACTQLSQGDFAAYRSGFFPSIRATLNHLVTDDRFYMDALEREAKSQPPHPDIEVFFTPAEPFDHCAALLAAQHTVDRRLIDYCLTLRDRDALSRVVTILRGSGPQEETRTRLLSHLFQHQIHHRGQAHAMLCATPVAPPQLDEFFSAMHAPLREKELAELGFSDADIWLAR